MIVKIALMFTLITIWIGLLVALINLFGATKFWLGHATERTQLKPLKRYSTVTIVVPAHNEELVISQTVQAILDMAYPSDKLELLLYADNCADNTANEMLKVVSKPEYAKQTIKVRQLLVCNIPNFARLFVMTSASICACNPTKLRA
ncbi:MAG TPA: glycosyltransferase [Candidatus Limosilactobacillus faecipullorum]|nr:glycosyltransferase [Candidatus Limosilactobacillus faecipullorum]